MLRLMSNNVWNRDKNAPAWEERGEDCSAPARAPLFVRIYEETRPDVIGMQEMTNLMTRELISGLAAKGLNYAVLWGNFTPIFYPVDILPDFALRLMQFNPMFHYVNFMRELVIYGTFPGITENLICVAMSVLMLFAGFWVFYKKQDHFVLYI